MAPLAGVPGNSSIFEQWVPEPSNFGERVLEFTLFSIQKSKK